MYSEKKAKEQVCDYAIYNNGNGDENENQITISDIQGI